MNRTEQMVYLKIPEAKTIVCIFSCVQEVPFNNLVSIRNFSKSAS